MNKSKVHAVLYWITTLWLSLGMVSSGIVQIIHLDVEVTAMEHLGYPIYILTLLGLWKILGVIAILVPKFPVVKEWAYAGFFFTMSGALFSHIARGDSWGNTVPALLLIVLTCTSWYLRPSSRKIFVSKNVAR